MSITTDYRIKKGVKEERLLYRHNKQRYEVIRSNFAQLERLIEQHTRYFSKCQAVKLNVQQSKGNLKGKHGPVASWHEAAALVSRHGKNTSTGKALRAPLPSNSPLTKAAKAFVFYSGAGFALTLIGALNLLLIPSMLINLLFAAIDQLMEYTTGADKSTVNAEPRRPALAK